MKKNYRGTGDNDNLATNSFGYRSPEIPVKKPKDTIRILCLGDSITFGWNYKSEEIYPARLEARLNRNIKQYRFDVINTGVPGNCAFQEYYDLKRALKFSPDIVIIQYTLNDITEPYVVFKRYGGLGIDYHGVEDILYIDYILSRYSSLYSFLKDMFARLRSPARGQAALRNKIRKDEIYNALNLVYKPDDPNLKKAWAECLRWMQKEVDICRAQGLECIVLISPFSFQIFEDETMAIPQNIVIAFALKNGIQYIDLLPIFREKIREKIIAKYSLLHETKYADLVSAHKADIKEGLKDYLEDHNHFNAEGHAFVADIIYEEVYEILKRKGLI